MNSKSKKKTLIAVLSVIVALIVIVAVLALSAISRPANYVYLPEQAEADSLLVSEIVDMISDSVVDDEGDIPEIAEIAIPEENVQALLRQVGYHLNLKMKDDGVSCAFSVNGGSLQAECSYPLPRGRAVIARATASPVIRDGVLLVNLHSLRAGSLPVPKFLGLVPDRITADTFKDEEARQAFDTIHHLEIAPDGGLRIGVYPERISSLIRVLVSGD